MRRRRAPKPDAARAARRRRIGASRRNAVRAIAATFILFGALAVVATGLRAQTAPTDGRVALTPAAADSPRETLAMFRDAMADIEALWDRPESDEALFHALRRAAETMDFSATRDGDSSGERLRRILMLDEVLGRVPLPPVSEIPGAEEAADAGLAEWVLPGTRMRIVRIDQGRRAGEWVFSARTVADLEIAWRRVRSLPYLPGEAGLLERHLAGPEDRFGVLRGVARLGSGIETASPRATLEGFLEHVNRAWALVQEARAGLAGRAPRMEPEATRELERAAARHLDRAAGMLDLRDVAPAERADRGLERALQLKEVFDRAPLPNLELVPDMAAGDPDSAPSRWRFPGSDIWIAKVTEGPRAGDYLFSADTVARIPTFYEAARRLPYRDGEGVGTAVVYASPGTSPGFYEYYISTPGFLIAEATALGRFTQSLPPALTRIVLGQTVWQWIGLAATIATTILLAWLAHRAVVLVSRRLPQPWRSWVQATSPLAAALVLSGGFAVVHDVLNVTGGVLTLIRSAEEIAVSIFLAWLVWRLFRAAAETVIATPRIASQGLDASLIRLAAGLAASIAGLVVLVRGLADLGVDVLPVLAGLGIGGLAVGLAVRPTLENMIGGLILFLDRPVRVGDFCQFGDHMGTVEEIGVRSTRIRCRDRTVVAVPNAKLVDMEITNYARADRMQIDCIIGVRYETTPDQIRFLLARMRETMHAHPMIHSPTVRVRLHEYGASSQDIRIRVFVTTTEWNTYFAVREDVLLRVADLVAEAGTSFAFPSQTLYMARDGGLDAERTAAAEQTVSGWRRRGNLPFPRLRSKRIEELAGTLDYPPRGSVEAVFRDEDQPIVEERLFIEDPDDGGDPGESGKPDLKA